MMLTIRNEVLKRGVNVISRIMITDLLTSDGAHPTGGTVIGALGFHTLTGEIHIFVLKDRLLSALSSRSSRTGAGQPTSSRVA